MFLHLNSFSINLLLDPCAYRRRKRIFYLFSLNIYHNKVNLKHFLTLNWKMKCSFFSLILLVLLLFSRHSNDNTFSCSFDFHDLLLYALLTSSMNFLIIIHMKWLIYIESRLKLIIIRCKANITQTSRVKNRFKTDIYVRVCSFGQFQNVKTHKANRMK